MIEIEKLSGKFSVRKLEENDLEEIRQICLSNPQFYEYTQARPEYDDIKHDMQVCPDGKSQDDKYYVGFFDDQSMIAVMDLIDGYPDEKTAFIGFFMMRRDAQGKGTGSAVISEVCSYLKDAGFAAVRLCINKGNPQSTHFWAKNGFVILNEYVRDDGTVYLAERNLR